MEYNKKSGVFHYFILIKFKEKRDSPVGDIIKRAKAKEVLYNSHIPIRMHQEFLKEMVGFRLIRIKDKQNIKLLI